MVSELECSESYDTDAAFIPTRTYVDELVVLRARQLLTPGALSSCSCSCLYTLLILYTIYTTVRVSAHGMLIPREERPLIVIHFLAVWSLQYTTTAAVRKLLSSPRLGSRYLPSDMSVVNAPWVQFLTVRRDAVRNFPNV